MRRIRIELLLLALAGIAVTTPAQAQIVDTLSDFSQSDSGWHGEIEGVFSATGGNTEIVRTAAAARIQYRVGDNLWRSMGGFVRATSEGEEIAESAFAHLRHNHYFRPAIASLAFVQVQENPFQRLRSRWLVGAGLRLEPLRRERLSLAVGLAQMTEIERTEVQPDREVHQRLSSFLSLNAALQEHVDLDVVAFVQPLWEDFADLRATLDATASVEIQGPLELTVGWVVTHDSRPPVEVEKTDWATTVGLKLEI